MAWRIIPARTDTWLGSPPSISHGKAIWKGKNPILRGLTITMVINHLLNGMILQVAHGEDVLLSYPPIFSIHYLVSTWETFQQKNLLDVVCLEAPLSKWRQKLPGLKLGVSPLRMPPLGGQLASYSLVKQGWMGGDVPNMLLHSFVSWTVHLAHIMGYYLYSPYISHLTLPLQLPHVYKFETQKKTANDYAGHSG